MSIRIARVILYFIMITAPVVLRTDMQVGVCKNRVTSSKALRVIQFKDNSNCYGLNSVYPKFIC